MAIGTVAVAFVVIALVVIGAVGFVLLSSSSNSHSTSTSSGFTGPHEVAFQQIAACSSSFWGIPWAVTIGNVTKAQPPGTTLPISYLQGTTDRSLAEIDFSLENGDYQYMINPSGFYFTPSSGSFTVSGSNLTIPIAYTGTSCTTSTSPPPNSNSPVPISEVETANVTIGGAPRTIAIDPNTGRIYVADYFYNNLTVVDAATNAVVARILLPANDNNGIAIDPNTNMVYVLVEGGVAVVNGTNNKVVGELHLNFGPGSMAYDPSTKIIYGSSEAGNGTLVGADVRTGKVTMNVSLGYWANSVVVDPQTHVVFAVGCQGSFVCGSMASAVNGTNGQILNEVTIGNDAYPRVTMNLATNVAYVSGSAQLVALDGNTGKIAFEVNSLACGTFDSMAADTFTNQLLAVYLDGNYVMAYDGTSGALVNMYSFPTSPEYIVFNSNSNVGYVTMGNQLLAFQNTAGPGHVNSTLTGSGQNCPLP